MSDPTLILGIDPGFNGGLVLLDVGTNVILWAITMPLAKPSVIATSTRREIATGEIVARLSPWAKNITMAVLERVNASPNMGVTSSFRFGEGFGLVRGVIAGLGIREQLVYPSVWKLELGLSADKQQSTTMAKKVFPGQAVMFGGKKSADIDEAALLAHYGRRFLTNG